MTGGKKPNGTEGSFSFLIFIAFAILGVVYSWPLFLNLSDAIPYAYSPDPVHKTAKMFQGDHLQAYYHIGLLKEAFLGYIDWFSNPYEFATEYAGWMVSDYFLPVSLIYLPFSFISGPLAYNILVILSFGLAGLSMYLWARELTGSRIAALSAGVVFNFSPIRLVELFGGHPAGLALFLFPFSLYYFDRAIKEKNLFYSGLSGFFAFALSVQYNYFAYYLLMFLMLYIPWRIIPQIKSDMASIGRFEEVKRLFVAGTPFATGMLATTGYMLFFKKTMVDTGTFAGGRTMGEVALYSPSLAAIWNPHSAGWSVYLGLPFLAIPLCLIVAAVLWKTTASKWDILFFTAVALVTYILAFGTTLNDNIPLYSLFYNHFPYFNFSRNPVKIMVISVSTVSILVAYLVAMASRKPALLMVSILVITLTAIDYHPRSAIGICLLDEGNPVYKRLAQEAGDKRVLNLPIWPGESSWSSIYIYYALQSRVPTINGYSPLVAKAYVDSVFTPLFPLNGGDLAEPHVKLLNDLGVGYIVFHEEAYPPKVSAYPSSFALSRLLNSPNLELVKKEEPLWLFKLLDKNRNTAQKPVTSPIGTIFQAEHLPAINGKHIEDPNAMNGVALSFSQEKGKEQTAIINAGPYRTFPAGEYRVFFRMRLGESVKPGPVAKIDVSGDLGRAVLAEKVIDASEFGQEGKYHYFALDYTLSPNKAWQVEFRTYSINASPIVFDSVYALMKGEDDPQLSYEAEKMFYTGRIVVDKEASNEKAVLSIPGRDPSDVMVYGPFRLYKRGKYTASFRIKTCGNKNVARLEVKSASSGKILAEKTVAPKHFATIEGYREIKVPYSLAGDDVIEFRVIFTGKAELYVDKISVEPST